MILLRLLFVRNSREFIRDFIIFFEFLYIDYVYFEVEFLFFVLLVSSLRCVFVVRRSRFVLESRWFCFSGWGDVFV